MSLCSRAWLGGSLAGQLLIRIMIMFIKLMSLAAWLWFWIIEANYELVCSLQILVNHSQHVCAAHKQAYKYRMCHQLQVALYLAFFSHLWTCACVLSNIHRRDKLAEASSRPSDSPEPEHQHPLVPTCALTLILTLSGLSSCKHLQILLINGFLIKHEFEMSHTFIVWWKWKHENDMHKQQSFPQYKVLTTK